MGKLLYKPTTGNFLLGALCGIYEAFVVLHFFQLTVHHSAQWPFDKHLCVIACLQSTVKATKPILPDVREKNIRHLTLSEIENYFVDMEKKISCQTGL